MSATEEPNPWLRSYQKLIPHLGPIVRYVTLTRLETGPQGTRGKIVTDSGLSLYTGELPWHGNQHGISCIPSCVVIARRIDSPKHGQCYCLTDVPGGRTMVEMHVGNFCGDVALGFKSDVEGCIILGNAWGEIAGQNCIINSRDALSRFEADLECLPFQLTIEWGPNVANPEAA